MIQVHFIQMDDYPADRCAISSTAFLLSLISGPLASLVVYRWRHSGTLLIGTVIAAGGLFLCAFSTDIYMVLVSIRIITGNQGAESYSYFSQRIELIYDLKNQT